MRQSTSVSRAMRHWQPGNHCTLCAQDGKVLEERVIRLKVCQEHGQDGHISRSWQAEEVVPRDETPSLLQQWLVAPVVGWLYGRAN